MMVAAIPMAGAVLRPTGSSMMSILTRRWYSFSCREVSSACRLLVITMTRFGLSGRTRSTVLCNMDLPLKTVMSCFGFLRRDKGQNLVPEPPARITTYIGLLFSYGWYADLMLNIADFRSPGK